MVNLQTPQGGGGEEEGGGKGHWSHKKSNTVKTYYRTIF
jgi:hypothetical protein